MVYNVFMLPIIPQKYHDSVIQIWSIAQYFRQQNTMRPMKLWKDTALPLAEVLVTK